MRKLLVYLFFFLGCSVAVAQVRSSEEALAFQYYQNGEYEKAAVIYKKLFGQKNNISLYDQYYNTLLKIKAYDEAEKLVQKQLKNDPDNYVYAVDIGRLYQESGRNEKAKEWFENLIRNLSPNEFAIRDLATNLYRAEAYDLAIKTFLAGRKVLNNDDAFAFDLLGLYRFRKDKAMLVHEYLNVLSKNPEVLLQAQSVIGNVFEENADYDLLKAAVLRRLQKDPQNIGLTEILTWSFIQQKDFDMALRQIIALDKRLKEEGDRVYDFSVVLLNNEAFETAVDALNYLISKGEDNRFYIPARIDLINAKSQLLISGKLDTKELVILENEYKTLLGEFGKNSRTAFAIRKLASLQAFHLNKLKEAEGLLEELLTISGLAPQVIAQIKLELGDIYILTGEVWEANLIYGQVEKQFANEPVGQEAKFRNGKLSYYRGDFTWAKAQLDVLKSSTSQLIANDALNLSLLIADNLWNETDSAALKMYAKADMLISINKTHEALKLLDSIDATYPGHSLTDDILMSRARLFIQQADYESAAVSLQKIIDDHSFDLWADDAIFTLADIFERKLQQPEKAKQLYQRIINDHPGSLYVIEARKRFRNLRGDKVG
ncbi:MAG TPA: tetratricopeptide repeat protein [Sphingobacteriaceae bacterium]